jgi:hypothetical protein
MTKRNLAQQKLENAVENIGALDAYFTCDIKCVKEAVQLVYHGERAIDIAEEYFGALQAEIGSWIH